MRLRGSVYELGEPDFPSGKPLYAIHLIANNPMSTIELVEGEKCADRLNALGLVATTSGGATSAGTVNTDALQGRTVRIWPDHDEAGRRFADDWSAILTRLGCPFSVIDVNALSLPDGGDCVDWLAAHPGAAGADIEALPMRESQPEPYNAPSDEPEARHVNQPRPSEAMLYGLAGDVGTTAAATTEANPYAVCMGFMSFLSGMAGRDIYLPVGNTRHHPRLFTLHVGRSSRGRKGDALSLVHRIRHTIDKLELGRKTVGGSLLGQVHTGGLSSREGLVMFIHNGFRQGKKEVPPVDDKRLWVVESEFANILQQSKRDGNTLSPALRDAWDGVSIKPATKSLPLWTTDPHIAIAAAITPTELVELMKARELSNGFANRFIIFWAERERLIPFPCATSEINLQGLVERTEEVLTFMKGDYPASKDSLAMTMSHEARTAYEHLYRDLNATTGSPRLDAILERRAPMLLRMAMLFAMTDLTLTIEVHHIEAAQSWVTYWVDSVRYIFGKAADEANIAERQEIADKLLAFLTQKGEATRTEITVECFNKHAPPGGLDAVIAELLNATPPKIVTMKRPRPSGNPGSPTTIYRPLSQITRANSAKSANCGAGIGFETLQTTANSVRTLRTVGDATGDGSPDFAEFANSSQHENTDAGRVDTHTSHSSHSSQGSTGIIEVEIR